MALTGGIKIYCRRGKCNILVEELCLWGALFGDDGWGERSMGISVYVCMYVQITLPKRA